MPQVGPVANLVASVQITAAFSGVSGPNPNPLLPNLTIPNFTAGLYQQWQNITPANGILAASQVMYYALSPIAASGTATVDMTAAHSNILGNSSATFGTGFSVLFFYLPSVTSALGVAEGLSVQASTITIGNNSGGSNQFIFWQNAAADGIILAPGDIVGGMRTVTATWPINGTHKSLLITNNDSSNAATPALLLIGA